MTLRRTLTLALAAGAFATAGFAANQASAPRRDVPPALAKQARIGLDAARTTALARVPGGEVRSEELEREHGKLIYSFDIAVPGKPGIEEVNVSAMNGKVMGKHHESARDEAREETPPHRP